MGEKSEFLPGQEFAGCNSYYFLREFSLLCDSLVFPSCFDFVPALVLLELLRLDAFSPEDFDSTVLLLERTFGPDGVSVTAFLLTFTSDLLLTPEFLSEERFVTDLFVTVVVDLRVVPVLYLFPEEFSDDLLYLSGCDLANISSPSLLWSGCEYVIL